MALPTALSFGKMVMYLESRTTPGNYIAPCGLTTRSFNISKETSDITLPDCADPDLPAWQARDVRALSWTVSGEGVLALEALIEWRTFAQSSQSRRVRVELTTAAGAGGGYWTGSGHLTSFEVSGTLGEKLQVSIEIQGDGEAVWTAL
jgi:predicted secreted protein